MGRSTAGLLVAQAIASESNRQSEKASSRWNSDAKRKRIANGVPAMLKEPGLDREPAQGKKEDQPMSRYSDRTLECIDCHQEFTWTAGEQDFYEKKNFQQPKRCKSCRKEASERSQHRGTARGN